MRLAGPQASLLTVSIFFIAVVSLNFFVQRFWFKHAWQVIGKIRQRAARIAFQSAWFAAVFVVFLGVLDWALRGHHLLPRDGRMAWFASFVRLWLTTSLLALVAIETVRLIKNLYSHSVPATGSADRQTGVNRSRRNFFRYATCLAGSLPFVAAAYGFTDERFEYQIRRVRIPVTNWPKELDGLTIVQVSDIHASEFMPRYEIRRAIEMANGLEADLAVVTGDFITGENDPLAECIDEIGRLRAPLGVWGCNGNHEIYAGVEALAQQLFQQHSMRLLRLQNSELSWHGAKFNLIGVDYQREYGLGQHASPCGAARAQKYSQHFAFPQPEFVLSGGGDGYRVEPGGPYARRAGQGRNPRPFAQPGSIHVGIHCRSLPSAIRKRSANGAGRLAKQRE